LSYNKLLDWTQVQGFTGCEFLKFDKV